MNRDYNDNSKPEKPKAFTLKLKDYFKKNKKSADDEFIRELIITNAILERLLIKQLKKNMDLEDILEERNSPFFYFNQN